MTAEGIERTETEMREEYESYPYYIRQMVDFEGFLSLRKILRGNQNDVKIDIQLSYDGTP